ncbi:MAG: cobalamin biosynthesis protein [Oscillospiraceae bacterium]
MKLALIAFTKKGGTLAQSLARGLTQSGDACTLALPERLASQLGEPSYESLENWTENAFATADGLIFVGACGIAVRAIAPFVKDKFSDPAVVSCDEGGAWAVPLLSGHVGGANALAKRVATLTGGSAAISTATDVNDLFAVDEWAGCKGLYLDSRELAKKVSAALLDGDTIGYASNFTLQGTLPQGVELGQHSLGFAVTLDDETAPFGETLHLIPKLLHLGIGCRRGTSLEAIEQAVDGVLAEHHLSRWAVKTAETIDLKQDEAGLLAFCEKRNLPLNCHSAEALAALPGEFTPSAFVEKTTGVDNVCERAAVLGGGRLLVKKQGRDGVTVAVSAEEYTVSFEGEQE